MNVTKTGSTLAGLLLSLACVGLGYVVVTSICPNYAGLSAIALCCSLDAETQNASKVISQDIHLAKSVESPNVNELLVCTSKGNISYTFDAARHCLTRIINSHSQKLLTRVDSFSFSLMRPDPHSANGALVPANRHNARAVACSWSSSRHLAGVKLDSDQIRLAPIILRNR